jgi:hypothetical protein
MLYLGIGRHARASTNWWRDAHGAVGQARQVSTPPQKLK